MPTRRTGTAAHRFAIGIPLVLGVSLATLATGCERPEPKLPKSLVAPRDPDAEGADADRGEPSADAGQTAPGDHHTG